MKQSFTKYSKMCEIKKKKKKKVAKQKNFIIVSLNFEIFFLLLSFAMLRKILPFLFLFENFSSKPHDFLAELYDRSAERECIMFD